VGLTLFAIAIVAYTPSASAFVALLAPNELRGIYLSLNSLCWALGYAIGPPLGGMAIDAGASFAINYWLLLAGSSLGMIGVLYLLGRLFWRSQQRQPPTITPTTTPKSDPNSPNSPDRVVK
jgi:MFS family permease